MLNHLSVDDFKQSGEGVGFGASEAGMMWRSSLEEVTPRPADWVGNTWTSSATGFNVSQPDEDQTPEPSRRATGSNSQVEHCTEDGDLLSVRYHTVLLEDCQWALNHRSNDVGQRFVKPER